MPTALLLLAALFPACGDEPAPALDIPSWAKVAPEQVAEAKMHAGWRLPRGVALQASLCPT